MTSDVIRIAIGLIKVRDIIQTQKKQINTKISDNNGLEDVKHRNEKLLDETYEKNARIFYDLPLIPIIIDNNYNHNNYHQKLSNDRSDKEHGFKRKTVITTAFKEDKLAQHIIPECVSPINVFSKPLDNSKNQKSLEDKKKQLRSNRLRMNEANCDSKLKKKSNK